MNIGHEMILASAGSGKTYALTNRLVRLLALGAAPERIVALTFTRKAAGEFFDAVLHKLARAAADPGAAARLAEEIAVPAAGPAEFLALLRTVVEAMPRLKLGTFDGFFARIAKNFPFELGLAGEFELIEAHAVQRAQGRALRRIFARSGRLTDAQTEFIEAFKQATFGREEKRLADKLTQFLRDHQEVFLEAPEAELWGNPGRIWPAGSDWFAGKGGLGEATARLREAMTTETWDERRREWWERLCLTLETWAPGAEMGTELKNVLKALPDMAVVTMASKKVEPAAALREALLAVARGVMRAELTRRIEMTRGLHAVIAAYEEVYHQSVRRAGRLTFADVQRLLQPDAAGGRRLSTLADGEGRMLIDYRLDAAIDHWLLDEFQDTSFGQWSVLRNLIDEAVQDPAGRRSFFYVGDVKQAIYAWRDGDPRLFREIFNHYNDAMPGTIAEGRLDLSWRSGPPVITMVNTVFGAAELLEELFPDGAAQAWNREWRPHASARPELGGQAALLLAEDEAERFATTLRLLREMPAPRPDFTVAVLVQKNETAAELADYLRREGSIAAMAEADLHVCTDNPAGAALLAMVQAAAHPGDSLAWMHVRMSPLGHALTVAGITTPEALTCRVLEQIASDGFEATLGDWCSRLTRLTSPDAFTRQRMRQFLAAAAEFDAGGSRDVAEFVGFMAGYTLREPDSVAVVRVMTIHKSKGLGFDVVILPDLEGQRLDQPRRGLAVQRDEDHAVRWVLDMPAKDMAERDAVLADHLREAGASACYEKLSLLYVAMTRARRGLYLIIEPLGDSRSRNFTRWLTETLGDDRGEVKLGRGIFAGAWAEGDVDWPAKLAAPLPMPKPKVVGRLDGRKAGTFRRLEARRPSEGWNGVVAAEALFAREAAGAALEFGRQVHDLFAEVSWLDGAVPEPLRKRLMEQGEAGAEVLACLEAPALAGIWRQEKGEVWRERAFEAVMAGAWVTGIFDRVVVRHDSAGRPVSATVYDFKTEEAAAAAADRHAPQLNLYRAATARLLGLSEATVTCFLVMTRSRQRLEIPPA